MVENVSTKSIASCIQNADIDNGLLNPSDLLPEGLSGSWPRYTHTWIAFCLLQLLERNGT
ncbi:Uncharacterized protein APZ42_017756 [Daphnia magna]|uniref:Uncharacterized protein n=1 Tax=Daphnia magna TaxID=35525 RepID=A0A164ZLY0_9CRUS|nr:Uncharacterized protein APZ42_017756 [Daphnia magna]